MIEQLSDGLWVPSSDAQIEQWRDKGYPHMQDKCLKQFLRWCDRNDKKFKMVLTYTVQMVAIGVCMMIKRLTLTVL